jgi:hypothetical protein
VGLNWERGHSRNIDVPEIWPSPPRSTC